MDILIKQIHFNSTQFKSIQLTVSVNKFNSKIFIKGIKTHPNIGDVYGGL